MTPYQEKLQDPRWQQVRLRVFDRDGFTCTICQSSTKTLAVHHEYYISGREPWDYPISAYKTVCENCHCDIKESDPALPQQWELIKSDIEAADAITIASGAVDFSRCADYGSQVLDLTLTSSDQPKLNATMPEFFAALVLVSMSNPTSALLFKTITELRASKLSEVTR